MKRASFLILFVLIAQLLEAQILSVTPAFPSQNDTVTVIYDASEGNGALVGYTPVYAHAGLITNQSTSPTDWKHVQGNWGTADPKVLMTPLGNNRHKLEFHMPTFYGFGAGVVVQKMAFVFRNASGNAVGRSSDGSDIYYDVYPANAGLVAQFLKPENTVLIAPTDSLECIVAASQFCEMKVYDNGNLAFQDSSKQQSFYLSSSTPGLHTVVLEAIDLSGSVFDTIYYAVEPPLDVASLPVGMDMGLTELNDTTVFFKLYAPGKNRVYVLTSINDYLPESQNAMTRTPGGAWWFKELTVPAGQPFSYQYLINGNLRVADPFSTQILDPWNDGYISSSTYPNLPAYPAGKTTGNVSLYQTAKSPYQWKNNTFQAPNKEELIIYELLLRDFVTTRNYQTLIDTLDYISRMGINAIELMPNSEFEGNLSWGYNASFHMALDKYYGTPDKFKEFVDSCHSRGIAVITDQVFNHAYGHNPIAQMWWDSSNNRPSANNPYMNQYCPHPPNCWGNDFNHYVQPTRDYMDRINTYWIEEFKIDGIRFDFTKGFTNNSNANNYDAGRIGELKRLANQLWSVDNDFYVILEHWGPNSEEKELSDHGMLLWGNAVHQYHEAAMGYTGDSDFKWGIYKERGWGNKHLITYSESHDEERSAYKIKTFGNSSGGYNTKNLPTMVDRKILTNAFLFTIPGPKMTYMFEELAYDESINDPCRICEKSILWSYYANTHRKRLYKYTAALINMRNTYGVFKTDNFIYALNGDSKRINLSVPDTNATVVGNFRVTSGDVYPNFQHTGTWYDYFTGDSIVVTNATAPLTYQPGEWHVYTDVNLGKASLIGMDEINGLPSTVALFPNPSNGIVELLVDTEEGTTVHYSLYDIMGREVENGRYNTSQNGIETLVLTSLPSGAYVLKVQFGSEIHTERIMIE